MFLHFPDERIQVNSLKHVLSNSSRFAGTGLFGGAQNKPLFGAAAPTTSATTGTGLFGTQQPAQTGGLFGGQQKSLFGGPATTTSAFSFNTVCWDLVLL